MGRRNSGQSIKASEHGGWQWKEWGRSGHLSRQMLETGGRQVQLSWGVYLRLLTSPLIR